VVTLELNLFFSPVVFHFRNQKTKHKLCSNKNQQFARPSVHQSVSYSVSQSLYHRPSAMILDVLMHI